MNNGITIGVVKKSGGNDSTKFPTAFLGTLTDTNTLEDILDNANLVVEKGNAPILFVTGSPTKSSTIQAVTRRYLWKLGSGTFAPIGSADLETKLELIDEKYLTSDDFTLILAQPNVQQTDLGIIAVDFMEYMNTTASYNFTNDEVTHVITFTKDDVDYAYFFAGVPATYGLGNTPITSNDVIFIYNSSNSGVQTDNSIVILNSYQKMLDLITNAQLISGTLYKFPYRSTNFVHGQRTVDSGIRNGTSSINGKIQSAEFDANFNDVHVGEEEILIAQAISTFQLSPIVHSEKYPQDIIEFMPYVDKLGINLSVYNGNTLSDETVVSGFNLQWDLEKEQVFFEMPNGYPINYGHFLYVYAEFQQIISNPISGGIVTSFQLFNTSQLPTIGPGGAKPQFIDENIATTTNGLGTGLIINFQSTNFDGATITVVNGGTGYSSGDLIFFRAYDNENTGEGWYQEYYDLIVEVFEATEISGGDVVENYYQDGCFEPIMPGITICQYPYTSDDPDFGYGKKMSRAEVSQDRERVYLIDLTQEDVENYIADTLSIEHIEGIVDCQGWITKREDTQNKVSMPLDWRNFKYRRWLYDLELVKSGMGVDYYGITSFDNIVGLESASTQWKDFPVSVEGQDLYDVQIKGIGAPNEHQWYLGETSNFVFMKNIFSLKILGAFSNSTIGGSMSYVQCMSAVRTLITANFSSFYNMSLINFIDGFFKLIPNFHGNKEFVSKNNNVVYSRDINITTGEQEITEI